MAVLWPLERFGGGHYLDCYTPILPLMSSSAPLRVAPSFLLLVVFCLRDAVCGLCITSRHIAAASRQTWSARDQV